MIAPERMNRRGFLTTAAAALTAPPAVAAMYAEEFNDDAVIDTDDLFRSCCEDSFYTFVQQFWDVLIPETPVWNWHIRYLCDELQAAAERVIRGEPKERDIVINISPGTTKSTIVSVMFQPWVWTRMPSARFIYGSHTQELAHDLSLKSRDIVLSERYQACWPMPLRSDQNTKTHWANEHRGWRFSTGVGGSVIGRHAHFLIVDDPIDPNAAGRVSEEDIKSANRWVSETLPSRKVDKLITLSILIMQRLHQNDPAGHLRDKFKSKPDKAPRFYVIPAEITEEIQPEPEHLVDYYQDDLMDPVRLSRAILEEAAIALGPFGYSGQHLQNPVPRGGGMFKTHRFVYGVPPRDIRWITLCRFWDKAATHKGGCYTAGALIGSANDPITRLPVYYVLDMKREQLGTDERERLIVKTAEEDARRFGSRRAVIIGLEEEPGASGKSDTNATVRRLHGYRVKPIKPTGDKVLRAIPFSVQVNEACVYLPPPEVAGSEWVHDFLEELKYFPFSTYKDQTDAGSGAFDIVSAGRRKVGAW